MPRGGQRKKQSKKRTKKSERVDTDNQPVVADAEVISLEDWIAANAKVLFLDMPFAGDVADQATAPQSLSTPAADNQATDAPSQVPNVSPFSYHRSARRCMG